MNGREGDRYREDHGHRNDHVSPGIPVDDKDEERGSGLILTVRANSGLSGDMFLAGLLRMTEIDEAETNRLLAAILPELAGTVHLTRRQVNNIGGWFAEIKLPPQHDHRTLEDISKLISASGMSDAAKCLATETFTLLAKAEATVHDKKPEDIHFHEIGALDSILDICMSCELFIRLSPSRFVVSPLPLADGRISCAHGVLPVPSPAVLELLEGIPVCSFPGEGETVTPTGVALLRCLRATFGSWPSIRVERHALVYGSRIFTNGSNGTLFVCGSEYVAE
jgi:hypothetical protein